MSSLTVGAVSQPGLLTYNGVTFGGNSLRATFEMEPVKDGTGRTVKYNQCTISLRQIFAFANASTAETDLGLMRSLLNRPSGSLVVTDMGFDVAINTGDADYDAEWGPWPGKLNIKPLGGNVAFEVTWSVTFFRADCYNGSSAINAANAVGKFKELVYDVAYDIDHRGLTTRRISGYYIVLLHRASVVTGGSATMITDTADQYRERIEPKIPVGFQRQAQSWKLSPDRSRMDFSIVDAQRLESWPIPNGITDIQMQHTVSTKGWNGSKWGVGLGLWLDCEIRGHAEVAYDDSMADGWKRVLAILSGRLDAAKAAGGLIFVVGLQVTEHVYGPRRIDFNLKFLSLGSLAVDDDGAKGKTDDIFRRAGMFLPPTAVKGERLSWQDWGKSMTQSWSQRGHANLEYTADQDQIVSLCDQQRGSGLADKNRPTAVVNGAGSMFNQCGQIRGEYLAWQNKISIHSPTFDVMHLPLSVKDQPTAIVKGTDGQKLPLTKKSPEAVSQPINGRITIILDGGAQRFGEWPEMPKFTEDGARPRGKYKTMISQEDAWHDSTETDVNGCLVKATVWWYKFSVTSSGEDLNAILGSLGRMLVATEDHPDGGHVTNTKP